MPVKRNVGIGCLVLCGLLFTGRISAQPVALTVQELEQSLRPHSETVTLTGPLGGTALISTRLAARVMGLFYAGADEINLIYALPDVKTDEFWNADSRRWTNAGGWRSKVSPQRHFYFRDGRWGRPPAMDPGSYHLVSHTDQSATFENSGEIFDTDSRGYRLTLRRTLTMVNGPRKVLTIPGSVQCVAMELHHTLRNDGAPTIGTDLHQTGLWTLVQVEGPGMCLMPLTQKDGIPLYRDHAEAYRAQGVQEQVQPIPKKKIIVADDLLAWPVDGTLKGKIGLHPAVAKPAYGFLKTTADATLLYVLEYPLDPQGLYVESPQYIPYDYGEAIQIYVGSGDGGYAGMQVHAPAHPIKTGEMLSHQVRLSVFRGPHEDILPLAAEILGVKMESLQRF